MKAGHECTIIQGRVSNLNVPSRHVTLNRRRIGGRLSRFEEGRISMYNRYIEGKSGKVFQVDLVHLKLANVDPLQRQWGRNDGELCGSCPQKCWLIHYHRGTLHYTVTLPVRQVYALYFLLAFLFILELLWKYLLPDLHPPLLLCSKRLPWTLERPGQDVAQPRPQYLDH